MCDNFGRVGCWDRQTHCECLEGETKIVLKGSGSQVEAPQSLVLAPNHRQARLAGPHPVRREELGHRK